LPIISNETILTLIAVLTVINTVSRWVGKKDTDGKYLAEEILKLRKRSHATENWRNTLNFNLSKIFISRREFDKEMSNIWKAIERKSEKE
jgi:hypothetical protein